MSHGSRTPPVPATSRPGGRRDGQEPWLLPPGPARLRWGLL